MENINEEKLLQSITMIQNNQQIIINAIKGLFENQQIINEKVNGVLTVLDSINKNCFETKEFFNNISLNFTNIDSSIRTLLNKSSDVEIQLQNSSEQYDSISNTLSEIINHVDNVNRSFNQFKLYSEI